MDLDGVAIFVKVIQAGSFSQAAKLLGMPNSTVSAKVAALEKRLGVTLLQRTTRSLRPTQAGEAYFQRAVRALEDLQTAENELENARTEPTGVLRLTAPTDVGHDIVPRLVQRYLDAHSSMAVELVITNRMVDLVGEAVDLALRAGELKDSGLIAKRYELGHFGLWASPDYVARRGEVRHPKDLAKDHFLKFSRFGNGAIRLSDGKETAHLTTSGRVQADDFETIRELAAHGEGIAFMPSFLCTEDNRLEKLVRVLPQWRGDKVSLSLVYPAQKFVPAKVRAFIAAADEVLKRK
jgi:DNA-binding transcriptional LysR family regulator